MIERSTFYYTPDDHERERASNSYLMSLIAIIGGVPLPIMNLIATLIFWMGNRKSTYFVRWHCTQALLSQLSMLMINSTGFWWTVSIVFTEQEITNEYLAYLAFAFVFNLVEFISTILLAIRTRKGIHSELWFFGSLTHDLVRP
ncbi:MAG: DUF4870 domain-containing protein [Bacteroidetes bacterium]|nr:DUF4870 domain-containing protein [Bacteroidota bacterium]